jgi:hypothetical protein
MSILECVTVAAKHCHLASMPTQWPDMISDGSWAIRRSALESLVRNIGRHAPKVPSFLKDAMLCDTGANNPLFDTFCTFDEATAIALEVAPILTAHEKSKGTMLCRFDAVNGDLRLIASAHYAKMLQDLFPGANWYTTGANKPIMLVHDKELLAFFMPIQCKKTIAGFTAPDQKLGLTNTEVLMYALGWTGGTLHQVSDAIRRIYNGEETRKSVSHKSLDDGAFQQFILNASPDEVRELVRYCHVARNTQSVAS